MVAGCYWEWFQENLTRKVRGIGQRRRKSKIVAFDLRSKEPFQSYNRACIPVVYGTWKTYWDADRIRKLGFSDSYLVSPRLRPSPLSIGEIVPVYRKKSGVRHGTLLSLATDLDSVWVPMMIKQV